MIEAIDKILGFYKAPNFAIIVVSLIIIIFIIIVGVKLKKQDPNKPTKGILLAAEALVDWTNGMCKGALGSRWKVFAPYVFFEAMFLAVANLSGLLGLTPPTSNSPSDTSYNLLIKLTNDVLELPVPPIIPIV